MANLFGLLYSHISIHVLRVEDDLAVGCNGSTRHISIHVLRVEDDAIPVIVTFPPDDFNPRPPCGGRLCSCIFYHLSQLISIHVLRVEDDRL